MYDLYLLQWANYETPSGQQHINISFYMKILQEVCNSKCPKALLCNIYKKAIESLNSEKHYENQTLGGLHMKNDIPYE